jgi:predicted aspartyl protease
MWRLLPALLLLAACSNADSGPCRLQPVADLAATLDNNRLEVTGQVNGADTVLLIDTGAERTLLTTATVNALQLPRSQRSVTRLIGVGGAVSNADAFADLQLGDADRRQRLAVADIPRLGGVIGGDVLSDYDLELDLPHRRVRLWHASGCGAADLPWTGPRATIPVQVTAGNRIRLPVTIDGQTLEALLDSGANRNLLQAEAARRAGVSQAALAADGTAIARGIDGGAIALHMHRFGAMTVGGLRIDRPEIGVADFQIQSADMLLGADYLRSRRVWIAYRTGQLFVQPAG